MAAPTLTAWVVELGACPVVPRTNKVDLYQGEVIGSVEASYSEGCVLAARFNVNQSTIPALLNG